MFAIVIIVVLFFSAFSIQLPWSITSTCREPSSLITFDDIKNINASGIPIPNGYGGLSWGNGMTFNGLNSSSGTGYTTGVVSPPNLAYDAFGNDIVITNATTKTFTINSFYSCAVWYDNITLEMTGTREGTTLYTKSVQLFMRNRTFIELNWSDIDSINLNSVCFWCCGAKHFTMDNLCVTL
ncbi:unnamed protein product [Adineta steineri]|uniref:Uncharacterized protein n=1 Tax=Adineta steineri TaxID=433720 RepID=A0A819KY46_9BILA|nr:unnamed protein product [Adineta steineri]CAF3954755.1 unnamed protein product [Adineta steineri]